MSYVNLHAQFPPMGATDFEECSARNTALQTDYEALLAVWEAKNAAYQKYKKDYDAWWLNEQRRRGKAAGEASAYASKLASYNARQKEYSIAMNAYYDALAYNAALDAADKKATDAVLSRYDIRLPNPSCLDASQKAEVQRACEGSQVKGFGATFSLSQYPACALNELNVCKTRKPVVVPPAAPTPPVKPAAPPPAAAQPSPVPDPGDKPKPPGYEKCDESSAGGLATFGLLALLVGGGAAFGYYQWKKRKKAA